MIARSVIVAYLAAASVALVACDPVHEDAVASLGGEERGVRQGPLHRPGQPCLLCHDGTIGNPPAFSLAGTVFQRVGSTTPAVGAVVNIVSSNNTTHSATTNAAGNFYITPQEYTPQYPLAISVTASGSTIEMKTLVNTAGSCATCHKDPAGPSAAGHVYLSDAGAP